jgi:hypothetical protein
MQSIPQKLKYIADELEKWTKCDSEQLVAWRDGFYSNFPEPFCSQWLEIVEWLRWHKPDMAKSITADMEGVIYSVKLAEQQRKDRPDLVFDLFIAQLHGRLLVGRLHCLSQIAKDDFNAGGNFDKKLTLDNLVNPVTCQLVAGIVRQRSFSVSRSLKSHCYPVIKSGNKNYCNADHAAVLWPKWKTYWKKKQSNK